MVSNSVVLQNVSIEDLTQIINTAVHKALRAAEQRKQPTPPAQLLSVSAAADELRQCSATLHNWRRAGKIKMVKTGNKWKVRSTEVEYIKQYGTRPTR